MNPLDTDERVTCTACRNRSAGWCTNALAAGLHPKHSRVEVGMQLATLKQWCAGFAAKPVRAAAGAERERVGVPA